VFSRHDPPAVAMMIVFAFAGYERLLEQLDPVPQRGSFELGRFENGELFVNILTRSEPRIVWC
jgi:hypothetical protein